MYDVVDADLDEYLFDSRLLERVLLETVDDRVAVKTAGDRTRGRAVVQQPVADYRLLEYAYLGVTGPLQLLREIVGRLVRYRRVADKDV